MKKIIAANWKLNKTPNEARSFFESFHKLLTPLKSSNEVVFFPSSIALEATQQMLKGSTVKFGAQNIYSKASGAFTGETSAEMVKSLGGNYALVGHSERRQIFGETDAICAEKVKFLIDLNMTPLLCIGETLEQRNLNQTKAVCEKQIKEGLSKVTGPEANAKVVIAYEPVWAIGTGVVATDEQVKEAHLQIFNYLNTLGFTSVPLLYGGSVKADSAKELSQIAHVDGFLVGGASLEPGSFSQIIANS